MSQSSIDFKEFQVFEEHLFEEIELESIVKLQFNEETLKKNFEVLIKILKDLKIGVGKSNQRSAQNEKDIKELQRDNQQLKKDVEGLKKDVEGLKDQNYNLLDEIQKLKEKDELQQQEINQLKDDNKANQDKIEEQQKVIDDLSKDNQKNKEDIAYLMDELKKLKSEIDSIKLQMSLFSGKGSGVDGNIAEVQIKLNDFIFHQNRGCIVKIIERNPEDQR